MGSVFGVEAVRSAGIRAAQQPGPVARRLVLATGSLIVAAALAVPAVGRANEAPPEVAQTTPLAPRSALTTAPLPANVPPSSSTAPATAPVALPVPRSLTTPAPVRRSVDWRGVAASPEARRMAQFAFEREDAHGLPFAVVDKKEARLLVFDADGRLVGATAALLGLARGDEVAPGVGAMVATGIPAALRTTPAGRYDSIPGPNLKGETVIWVDYDAAFAIHRLRPAPASERRAERLASASPDDNRISLGCVIVTGEFFDQVVQPVLGRGPGVVYVLPEPAPAPLAGTTTPTTPTAPVALSATPSGGGGTVGARMTKVAGGDRL